jgi:hypothetical protein
MAQQWLATAVHAAYRGRDDALDDADRAAGVRAWLASLPLEHAVISALVEPIIALEDGLRAAARDGEGGTRSGGIVAR